MDCLISYFDETEFSELLNINPEIKNVDGEDIVALVQMLKDIKLTDDKIKEIIYSNPFYLTRIPNDIDELMGTFKKYGVDDLDALFYNSPWLLDKDGDEVDIYITEKVKSGIEKEDAIDLLLTDIEF